jgi:hypothetical protein
MYKIIISFIFIFFSRYSLSEQFCDAPSVKDGGFNVENLNDENPLKLLGMMANIFSWNLSKEDKCLHSEAVLQALFSLDTHESLKWKNEKNKTAGEIDILLIRPRQGGYCKDYKVSISKDSKYRTLKKRACISYCSHRIEFINLDKNGKCIRKKDRLGDPECGFTLGDMIGPYMPIKCK